MQKKYIYYLSIASAILVLASGVFVLLFGGGRRIIIFNSETLSEIGASIGNFLWEPLEETKKKESNPKILEESGKMSASKNSDWWLNSGGLMNLEDNVFSTNISRLKKNSYWQKTYAKTNPQDTDNGYLPQNIFRLVSRKEQQNFFQTVYFYIENVNLTDSKNRNESNGILFFNRYMDGDNLYYAGLRVDGNAVIKKKIDEKYFTMAEKEFTDKAKEYDRDKNPNLIPAKKWIGLKSEIDNDNETVNIKLYADWSGNGDWNLLLEAKDKEDKYGKSPFLKKGRTGIRTDFLDVRFKDYEIKPL
jgi:hypothetical protein